MAEVTSRQCAYCGRESGRLDDAEHCPVCRLYHVPAEEAGIVRDLRSIGDAIRSAVTEGYAHPDDIREEVERILESPEIAESRDSASKIISSSSMPIV